MKRVKTTNDYSSLHVVEIRPRAEAPRCYGEYDDCSGDFCLEYHDPCMSIVAAMRFRGATDPESYPASIVKFLIDHRDEFVVLQDAVLEAVRADFNYYKIEAEIDGSGRYRLLSVKNRPAAQLAYEIDEPNGLFLIRQQE